MKVTEEKKDETKEEVQQAINLRQSLSTCFKHDQTSRDFTHEEFGS